MKVFRADSMTDTALDEIISMLRRGGVMAFPTDTAYGLGADPFNEAAIDRIFQIKGRAETKPLLLLVSSIAMAESVADISPRFYAVAKDFWPGPLTIILSAKPSLPAKLTARTNTIGLRWPVAPFASSAIERFGKPLTATSANRSGMPSTVTAEEVRAQLGETIDLLVDGGTLPARGGSTLLDLTADPPVLLREGPITFERLHELFKGSIRRQVA